MPFELTNRHQQRSTLGAAIPWLPMRLSFFRSGLRKVAARWHPCFAHPDRRNDKAHEDGAASHEVSFGCRVRIDQWFVSQPAMGPRRKTQTMPGGPAGLTLAERMDSDSCSAALAQRGLLPPSASGPLDVLAKQRTKLMEEAEQGGFFKFPVAVNDHTPLEEPAEPSHRRLLGHFKGVVNGVEYLIPFKAGCQIWHWVQAEVALFPVETKFCCINAKGEIASLNEEIGESIYMGSLGHHGRGRRPQDRSSGKGRY